MNTTSLGTIVKKSVGWSIGLSVLMILAGFLAIAVPQAAGIAANLLVASSFSVGQPIWCLPGTRARRAEFSGNCWWAFSIFSSDATCCFVQ